MKEGFRRTLGAILDATLPEEFAGRALEFKPYFGAVAGYVDGRIFVSHGNFGLALELPLVLPFSAAKPMERRTFVTGLAKGFEIRPQIANGVAAHMGRLLALSRPDPAMRGPN